MPENKLKSNQLNFFEVIAMSVAIMSPTSAMASNVCFMAGLASYSVALVFLITIVVVAIIAIAFIKFNKVFSTSGSVYTFTVASLGDRAGTVCGWGLFIAYFAFAAGACGVCGAFLSALISISFGVNINWLLFSLIFLMLVWFFSYHGISMGAKVMLVTEGIAMSLLFIMSIVILTKVGIAGNLSAKPFTLNGNSFSAVGAAVIFGILSFAGFEGSSSLGEESKNPKKYIPLSIIFTLIIVGLFFVIVSYSMIVGFGVNANGLSTFVHSSSPLTDLSEMYMGKWYSVVLTLCTVISAFACALGCSTGASRLLYAMGNDNKLPSAFSKVHKKYGSPYFSVNVIVIGSVIINLCLFKNSGLTNWGYLGTIGTLGIVLCYLLTTLGAIVYFLKNKAWKAKDVILPVIGLIILVFVFIANIYPVPAFPMSLTPYICVAFILIATIYSIRYSKNKHSNDKEDPVETPVAK